MRPWRTVLVVAGALVALVALGLMAAGGTLVWAHTTQRDAGGFYNTPTERLHTASYAITSQVDLGSRPSDQDWVPAHPLGTVRISATSLNGTPVFVGIARRADIDSWLAGVAHEHVTSMRFGPFHTETEQVAGTRPAAAPASQPFWAASASGTGTQTVLWTSQGGRWAALVMNADGAPAVAVAVKVGAKTGVLLPAGIVVAALGLLAVGLAALLLFLGLRRMPDEGAAVPAELSAGRPGVTGAGVEAAPGTYPVRLDGHLDPGLSRWLWLVKFVLVIPHVIVLAFLWLAVTVLTVIAGFAILFTGRYPRTIFDFNAGVMLWTWRVSFYAIGAFGTDRYPPFTLARDPAYPADLVIDYPDQLSRGLVLVKWWLLALPHYLVVAVFAGGLGFGWNGAWRAAGPSGLISLLVLVAAVILAVRGRYPESIFDFVMGMNRWCFRVLTYAALMRDEYPPFRLDTGGTDPGSMPTLPPRPAPDRGGELIATGR